MFKNIKVGRAALTGAGLLAMAAACAFGGAATAGTLTLDAPAGVHSTEVASTPMEKPTFPKNSHGLTYGSAMKAGSEADLPDLVQVQATNGTTGFVKEAQLRAASGENFTSPEDALAWQKANDGKANTITVFASDGVTKVGEFVIEIDTGEVVRG